MSFMTSDEVGKIGFKHVGCDVRISRFAVFHNPGKVSIGDHSRIDDFCVVSAGEGGIVIGSHVHVAIYCSLMGRATIQLDDFCNLSSRVAIYSTSDDYSGNSLTNPTVPDIYKTLSIAPVRLGRHVIVGCGTVILPGAVLNEGVAVGSLSLVTHSLPEFTICAGVPAKPLKSRSRQVLDLEQQYLDSLRNGQ